MQASATASTYEARTVRPLVVQLASMDDFIVRTPPAGAFCKNVPVVNRGISHGTMAVRRPACEAKFLERFGDSLHRVGRDAEKPLDRGRAGGRAARSECSGAATQLPTWRFASRGAHHAKKPAGAAKAPFVNNGTDLPAP
jgi:hypothetical protein